MISKTSAADMLYLEQGIKPETKLSLLAFTFLQVIIIIRNQFTDISPIVKFKGSPVLLSNIPSIYMRHYCKSHILTV